MKNFAKNLFEILVQASQHGIRALIGRFGTAASRRTPIPEAHEAAHLELMEEASATAGELTPSTVAPGAKRVNRKRLVAVAFLLLLLLAAAFGVLRWRDRRTESDAAPGKDTWVSQYSKANETALTTGSVPGLDALAAGAAGDLLRQQLMDRLIARVAYDQSLKHVAAKPPSALALDWKAQDPEAVQAYADAMLEDLDQAVASGQFESALAQAQALSNAQGLFADSHSINREMSLKLATGRAILAAGRMPSGPWVKSVNDWLAAEAKDLPGTLRLDALMALAKRDLLAGDFGVAREKLAVVASALDQGVPDANARQADLLEMRLANLMLQAGAFEATRKRLEPLIARSVSAARCHVYLDAVMTWADVAVQQAQYARAEQAYQQAGTCLSSKGGPQVLFQEGQLQNGLGVLLTQLGRSEDADNALKRAGEVWQNSLPPHHAWRGSLQNNLGAWHRSQGDFEAARMDYVAAAQIWREGLGEAHPMMATFHNNVAELDMLMSRLDGVNDSLQRALDMRRQAFGDNHPWTALVVSNLGEYLAIIGQSSPAFEQHTQALKVRELTLGNAHPDTAMSLNNLGAILFGNQDLRQAQEKFSMALKINKTALGELHPRTLLSMSHLAASQMALGDYDQAQGLLLQAVDGLRAQDSGSALLHSALVKLAEAEVVLEKQDQAEGHYLAALDLADQGDRRALLAGSQTAYKALISLYSQRKDGLAARQLARRFPWARP